jgi:hypothetical protein
MSSKSSLTDVERKELNKKLRRNQSLNINIIKYYNIRILHQLNLSRDIKSIIVKYYQSPIEKVYKLHKFGKMYCKCCFIFLNDMEYYTQYCGQNEYICMNCSFKYFGKEKVNLSITNGSIWTIMTIGTKYYLPNVVNAKVDIYRKITNLFNYIKICRSCKNPKDLKCGLCLIDCNNNWKLLSPSINNEKYYNKVSLCFLCYDNIFKLLFRIDTFTDNQFKICECV